MEVMEAVAAPFEYFDFVVDAFGDGVGDGIVEVGEDTLLPSVEAPGELLEGIQSAVRATPGPLSFRKASASSRVSQA